MTQENDLEEITRETFVDAIFDTADSFSSEIYDLEKQRSQVYQLYNRMLEDECKYKIRYFMEGDTIRYERVLKKSIGFKK
jgi:hypothetical protein